LGNDRPCEPKKNGASVIYLFKKIVLMFTGTEPENIIEGGEIINTLLTKKF
jgi:hypothetical protein